MGLDQRGDHRADIQGIRAIAVSAVVAFHAGLPLPGGFTGVDIFFVISGFVITRMLRREWEHSGDLHLSQFYFRRFKRLMPALSLLVTCVAIANLLLLSPLGSEVRVSAFTGIASILMSANLAISKMTGDYFSPAADGNPLLNTWSLSVEEQFYVLFPAVLLITLSIAASKKSQRLPIIVLALLGAASILLMVRGHLQSTFGEHFRFYSPAARAWEFAAGSWLALLEPRITPPSKRMSLILALAAIASIVMSFILLGKSPTSLGLAVSFPVMSTAALIYAGSSGANNNVVLRALAWTPVKAIGDISYSWYLWHWPILVLVSVVYASTLAKFFAVLLSLLIAFLSTRYVEDPLRRKTITGTSRRLAFIGCVTAPPIVACCLLLLANSFSYWSNTIKSYKNSIDAHHAAYDAGCASGYVPASLSNEDKCRWNTSGSGMPIYLIGDSNADHLSEALIGAAHQLGRPLFIHSQLGCPFIGRSWADATDERMAECLKTSDSIISLFRATRPGTVVLGVSDSLFIGVAVGPTRDTESSDPRIWKPYLQRELERLIALLQAEGHHVLLVLPLPKFVSEDRKRVLFEVGKCSTIGVLQRICPKEISLPQEYHERLQSDAREIINLAAERTKSALVDLFPPFCPDRTCSNFGRNGIQYRDAGHITVEASLSLADVFSRALSSSSQDGMAPTTRDDTISSSFSTLRAEPRLYK
jgi:peptidoglycan/LPS O-acetylase OafA/YrhL